MEFLRDISPLIINSSFASGSREFTEADIACIRAPGNVGAQWSISSSGLHQLQEELKHFLNQTALPSAPQIYLDYSLVRKGQAIEQDAQPSSYSILLAGSQNTSLSQENAFGLLAMLSSPNQTEVCSSGMNVRRTRSILCSVYDRRRETDAEIHSPPSRYGGYQIRHTSTECSIDFAAARKISLVGYC